MQHIIIDSYKLYQQHIGEKVCLHGKYEPLLLPVSKRPSSEKVFSGRIAIVLNDSTYIALETHEDGIRNQNEIQLYSGQMVKVVGVINTYVQLWGSPEEQAIVMPAITLIESIERLEKK